MAESKLTKAKLISQLDDKIQNLNLLKAALQAELHLKQADLAGYKKRFDELLSGKGKK
ncbi:MAG TPA: hypothetical protein VGK59_19245 [Ohtaekwangia sp.]